MARSKDNNGKHIAILVVMYAVLTGLLLAFLSWNMASTPFAYEFLQSVGIAGVENLTDEAVRQVWFSVMAGTYGTTAGLSVLLVAVLFLLGFLIGRGHTGGGDDEEYDDEPPRTPAKPLLPEERHTARVPRLVPREESSDSEFDDEVITKVTVGEGRECEV